MKLLRVGPAGEERPALIDAQGVIRDLSTVISDITGETLAPEVLAELAQLDVQRLPEIAAGIRIGPCVGSIPKIVGVGLNYRDHVAQANVPVPVNPVLFIKPSTTLSGPFDNIIVPANSEQSDWEVEVAVVIGTLARNVSVDAAMEHVAGFCLANDITERAWAKRSGQLINGKCGDTFTPLGPWLVTQDEIEDPQKLDLFLDLNDQRYQTGNTRDMIFPIRDLISHVSEFMTLLPGDILLTGTPAGVGLRSTPARFLSPGDTVRLGVAGLGEQLAYVVSRAEAGPNNFLEGQTLPHRSLENTK